MRLIGALSNTGFQQRLKRLNHLREKLLARAATNPRPSRKLKRRCGAVQDAIITVLQAATEPMRVGEVHAAVEDTLGGPVSLDTVNSCLSTGARGEHARFQRIRTGWYRVREASD